MKKIQEIVRLRLGLGASVREIAAACNIGRSTVADYLARIEQAKLSWPGASELAEEVLLSKLFPQEDSGGEPGRKEPDWNEVRHELGRKGVTLKLLWEERIRLDPAFYSYSRFARLYREWLKSSQVTMLQHHVAGEKLYVDWAGQKLRVVNPATGEVEPASIFVAAMGYSQYIFAKACTSESSEEWIQAHCDCFEYYGALPQVVVPDNLKTGVHTPCRFEPEINRTYLELAEHYAVAILPARVRKPKDKAKVENAVLQVERWVLAPLRDRTFFTIQEANAALQAELTSLNRKTMKGVGCSRQSLFESDERAQMRELPSERYTFARWKTGKVAPDYHVEVEGHLYSCPFQLVGSQVEARYTLTVVEIFHAGNRVAAHRRSLKKRGFTTEPDHMPARHAKQAGWTPDKMRRSAESIGAGVLAFVEAVLASKAHPEQGYRAIKGVLGLEREFGAERLSLACLKAVTTGALSYRHVKSILVHRLEGVDIPSPQGVLPMHQNIRGSEFYAQGEVR